MPNHPPQVSTAQLWETYQTCGNFSEVSRITGVSVSGVRQRLIDAGYYKPRIRYISTHLKVRVQLDIDEGDYNYLKSLPGKITYHIRQAILNYRYNPNSKQNERITERSD